MRQIEAGQSKTKHFDNLTRQWKQEVIDQYRIEREQAEFMGNLLVEEIEFKAKRRKVHKGRSRRCKYKRQGGQRRIYK